MFHALSTSCGPAAFSHRKGMCCCLLPHTAVPRCSKEIPEVRYTEVMFLPTQLQSDFLCIPSFILFGVSGMFQYIMHVGTSFYKRCFPPAQPSPATRQQNQALSVKLSKTESGAICIFLVFRGCLTWAWDTSSLLCAGEDIQAGVVRQESRGW